MPGLRETLEAATPDDNYAGYGEIMEALERERDEWRALVLDMGETLRYVSKFLNDAPNLDAETRALLARLDQLGKEPSDG